MGYRRVLLCALFLCVFQVYLTEAIRTRFIRTRYYYATSYYRYSYNYYYYSSSISVGAIVGIVIGCLASVALLIVGIVICCVCCCAAAKSPGNTGGQVIHAPGQQTVTTVSSLQMTSNVPNSTIQQPELQQSPGGFKYSAPPPAYNDVNGVNNYGFQPN